MPLVLAGCAGSPDVFSGTVRYDAALVGSLAGGRVVSTQKRAGERVRTGEVILRLDDRDARGAYDAAVGKVAQAQAAFDEARNGPRPQEGERARSQAAAAAAQYAQNLDGRNAAAADDALAAKAYGRAASLYATGDISKDAYDRARRDRDAADARLAQASNGVRAGSAQYEAQQASYALVQAGTRVEDVTQARAGVQQARAALEQARVRLDETIVRAPANGRIETFDLHPGDLVGPNTPVATIVLDQKPYVMIYVPQHDLHAFGVGKHVRVFSEALNQTFDAVEEEQDISAQFTPRDVQTAEDRAELVFGIKLRIEDQKHDLPSGSSVTVSP